MASYVYKDVLTRASTTIQVIEDVAIYKAQLFSTNGNIFSQRDTTSEISVKVFKGLEDITNRFTDIVWKRFTSSGNNIVEDTKWGEQHNGKKTIVITRDDINEKANIQVEVYTTISGQRTLAASDFITFIDVNDMDGSPTPPSNPKDGDLWLDTSVMPPRLMVWDNSLGSWIEVTMAGRDRRNLLRNSNFFKKSIDYWTKIGTPTIEIESLSGKKWARIKSTSQTGYCGISQIIDATPKAQYSFQMLSKIYTQSVYPNGNVVVAFNSINNKGVKTLIKEVNYDIGEDPKVFTQAFTSLDDTARIEVIISGQKNTDFDFIVTNTKLENYPEPTAWELAIEDMQEALDDKVGNSAEEVFNSLTDDGKMQGIYIDVDEHGVKNYYINGRYVNAKNLKVVNKNGVTTLYIDEDGNVSLNVSSFTLTAGADTNLATKEDIDGIQIGTRNLLRDSLKDRVFKRFLEIDVRDILEPHINEDICISFDCKVNEGGTSRELTMYAYQSNGISIADKFKFTPTFTYKRFSFKTKVKDWGINNPEYSKGSIAFYDFEGNNNFTIRKIKIELGNIASSYTEAPEDTKAEIDKVQNNLDNLQIGTRNLLVGTDFRDPSLWNYNINKWWTVLSKLTPNNNPSFYCQSTGETQPQWFWVKQSFKKMAIGKTYTFSASVYIPSDHGIDQGISIEAICFNSELKRTHTEGKRIDITQVDKWVTYSVTFTVPADTTSIDCGVFMVQNGKAYVGDYILTEGNKTVAWSYSEEDIKNGIQIGVRNYIPNSAFKKGMEGYLIQNESKPGTIELVEFEGRQCIKFTDIGCWDVSKYLRTPTFSFPGDEYLTFSMDVYITKGTKFFIDPDRILDQGDFAIEIPERNKWLRIGGTTVKKSRISGDTSIAIYAARDTETISGYLTLLKAETGTKPSGWTEAPEDTEASINNKVDIGGSIDDVNQSSGQIEYPKLKIKGAITFEDLSTDNIANNFVPKRDSQGNVTSTLINGATIVAGSITGDLIKAYQLVVTKRKLENGKWIDTTIPTFSISQEGLIQASGTFKSFNFSGDETNLSNSKEGWIITNDGQSVFNNSIIRGRVELPNAGVTDSCVPNNEKIDLTKYCRNLLNTPLIVTNPEDAIYASSGFPNPPVGMTINSYDQVDNKIKRGEASSNGNCWAIIAAVKAYNHISDTASKNKLKDIIVKSANFMVNNLSVGRFNSMDFKFVDVNYKYNATSKTWERSNYKEIYISSLWLQVRSLLLAFEMTGTTSYKDTALIILDSLYNMHKYINQGVENNELPAKLKGASYEFLACDNISSSNRFSPSRHFAHQMGYYLCQAIEEVTKIVGDNERTTPKGDKYKPSSIVDNYRNYLEKAYNDGLTTSPTGLPYGCYYRTGEAPNIKYVQGNWDFIEGTWGDSWFVGDVVCYTIYSYAKIGLKDIAKQYLDAYYNARVDVNSSDWGSRFLGDLVFYDRLDFQGHHLADDNSISITYTALFYEIARELGYEKYYNICARTLYKWQVKSSNKLIDGGYPWDVSKDGQTLELKSYGEIINSECHKRLFLKNNEYVTDDNPVRIWAGTTFKDRNNAPYKVLQDGTVISTRGEFGGTFTGRLEIGNISIYDDDTSYGVIDIKNNDNSQSIIRIGEDYSVFKSDVFIGDKDNYMFKSNMATKQLVSGKQSSIKFEFERDEGEDGIFSKSITINGDKIRFNENEFMKSIYNGVLQIGSTSPKSRVLFRSAHDSEIDGEQGIVDVEVHGKLGVTQTLNLGNVDIVPVYPEGLDFFIN